MFFLVEFERHVKILERKLDSVVEEDGVKESVTLPECFMGLNPHFKSASNAIELRSALFPYILFLFIFIL